MKFRLQNTDISNPRKIKHNNKLIEEEINKINKKAEDIEVRIFKNELKLNAPSQKQLSSGEYIEQIMFLRMSDLNGNPIAGLNIKGLKDYVKLKKKMIQRGIL